MKQKDYGDIPHIPKGLDKTEPLETNPAKRSGKIPQVRGKIKEYLNYLKIPFKK